MRVLSKSLRILQALEGVFKKVFLGVMMLGVLDFSEAKQTSLFQSPLIVGASVSADWSSLSPGKVLSLRYTSKQNIETVARPGRPSYDVLPLLSENQLKGRSIIIGFDLFFWDTTGPSVQKSEAALSRLLNEAKRHRVPVVIGDVPELLRGHQPRRAEINAMIRRSCQTKSLCHVVPLDRLHQQVLREGALTINGRRYTMSELVPDGLHVNKTASEYLADYTRDAIRTISRNH